jgi:hypothetical protein
MYWVAFVAFGQPSFWIAVFLGCVVALIPSFTWTYINRTYFPEDYHIIQEQDVMRKKITMPEEEKISSAKFAPQPIPKTKYTGFAFAGGSEKPKPMRKSKVEEDSSEDLHRSTSVANLTKNDMSQHEDL